MVAYRRAMVAIDQQLAERRAMTMELSGVVNRAADSVARGTEAVTSVIDDARESAGAVGAWLGTAATVVTTPRTAAAVGLLRGVQWWKSRRRAADVPRPS